MSNQESSNVLRPHCRVELTCISRLCTSMLTVLLVLNRLQAFCSCTPTAPKKVKTDGLICTEREIIALVVHMPIHGQAIEKHLFDRRPAKNTAEATLEPVHNHRSRVSITYLIDILKPEEPDISMLPRFLEGKDMDLWWKSGILPSKGC